MSLLRRYGQVLAIPGARGALVASTIGRIAAGMAGLALILLVRERGGSYGLAGVCAAAFALGFALLSPVRARKADKRGQTGVLLASAAGFPAGLLAVLAVSESTLPLGLATIGAAFSGAFFPPFGPSMRTLWAGIEDLPVRSSAFALEAVLVEVSFVLGPLAVAVGQALGGPRSAVLGAAVFGGVGALLLARNPMSRAWAPHGERSTHPLGPLRSPMVRRLLLATLCVGVAFGAVDVAVPAFAEEHHSLAASGVLLSLWSLGSMLGGIIYGGINPRRSAIEQYRLLLLGVAVVSALPLLAWSIPTLGLLLAVFGVAIAPFFITNSHLIADYAPAGTTTEAFAWMATAIFGGAAVGNAVAGALVSSTGTPRAAFAITAALGFVALATSLLPGAPRAVTSTSVTA